MSGTKLLATSSSRVKDVREGVVEVFLHEDVVGKAQLGVVAHHDGVDVRRGYHARGVGKERVHGVLVALVLAVDASELEAREVLAERDVRGAPRMHILT